MFGSKKSIQVDTIIGEGTEVFGNIRYSAGLHIDGTIQGNIEVSPDAGPCSLVVSENAKVVGTLSVADITIGGCIEGDIHAVGTVEMLATARVKGRVSYRSLCMDQGAQVNGELISHAGALEQRLLLAQNDDIGDSITIELESV